MNCATSIYGEAFSCGGGGVCINATCICPPGRSADVAFLKYPDCYATEWFSTFHFVVVLLMCLVVLYGGATAVGTTRNSARKTVIGSCVTVFSVVVYLIVWYAQGATCTAAGTMLIVFTIDGTAAVAYYVIYTLMGPLYKAANRDPTNMSRVLFGVYMVTAIGVTSSGIVASLYVDDWRAYSNWIMSIVVYLIFSISFAAAQLYFKTEKVIALIIGIRKDLKGGSRSAVIPEESSGGGSKRVSVAASSMNESSVHSSTGKETAPNSTTHAASSAVKSTAVASTSSKKYATNRRSRKSSKSGMDDYLARIRKLRMWVLILVPFIVVCLVVVLIMHFSFSQVPSSYVVFFLMQSQVVVINYVAMTYATNPAWAAPLTTSAGAIKRGVRNTLVAPRLKKLASSTTSSAGPVG